MTTMMGKRIRMGHAIAPATDVEEGRIVGYKDTAGYIVAIKGDAGWQFTPHEMMFVQVPVELDETGWWVRDGEFTIVETPVTA